MLLVIFGAGASFDSAVGDPLHQPPPLAAHLVNARFFELTSEFPLSRPIIDRIRNRSGSGATSLEAELARLSEDAAHRPDRRQQLVAFRFYLRRVITTSISRWVQWTQGMTRYLTLVNELTDWQARTGERVLLATFNYDELLDMAVQNHIDDWRLNDIDRFVDREDFRLFKLHGPTGWSREVPGFFPRGTRSLEAAMDLAAADGLRGGVIVAWPPMAEVGLQGEVSLPALAVPMAGKTEFECPPEHVDALEAGLEQVTHVLIIGWRAAEAHAVKMLEGLMPGYALGIVSGSQEDVAEVIHNLGPIVGPRGRPRLVMPGGFTELVNNLDALHGFLNER